MITDPASLPSVGYLGLESKPAGAPLGLLFALGRAAAGRGGRGGLVDDGAEFERHLEHASPWPRRVWRHALSDLLALLPFVGFLQAHHRVALHLEGTAWLALGGGL
eukprot:1417110-Rhodomonas_salina.1